MTPAPWYSSGGVRIYVAHVLDVLAGLEAGSVQTCITSPPYWGLRSYGTQSQSWGGDPSCPHNLVAAPGKVLTGGNGTASAKQVTNAGSQYGNLWEETHPAGYRASDTNPGPLQSAGNTNRERFGGYVCSACGGYYGELGAEPTPEMFVEHIVQVFRAVRRVLRDDGTVWLNLGSSFISSIIESEEYVLRDDLTAEEQAYVYAELAKQFLADAQAMSAVPAPDGRSEYDMPPMLFSSEGSSRELPDPGV